MTEQRTPCSSARAVLAPIALVVSGALASAQGTGQGEDLYDVSFEELLQFEVVRAPSLIEASMLEVGSSVSRVTEEDWRRRGAQRTYDALEGLPGVFVTTGLGGIQLPVFRGFGQISGLGHSATLLDGTPLNTYGSGLAYYLASDISLEVLESIEVVRGPGSSIYGSDAFSGVVALQTWSPDSDVFEARAEVGNFGRHSESLRFSQELSSDIRMTFAGSFRSVSDAEQKYPYTDSVSALTVDSKAEHETDSWTGLLKFAMGDTEFSWLRSEYDEQGTVDLGESITAGIFNGAQADFESKLDVVSLTHEYSPSDDYSVVGRAYYLEGTFDTERPWLMGGPVVSGAPGANGAQFSEDERAGASLRVHKPFGQSNLQFVGGAGFDWMRNADGGGPSQTPVASSPGSGKHREVYSLFGQLDYASTEQLHFLLGARLEDYSDFGSHLSPRAGVVVHPTESSALKLLYGHAFRAPSSVEQGTIPGIAIGQGDALDPETIDTWELVWMEEMQVLQYGITLFHNSFDEGIAFAIPPGGPPAQIINTNEAESYGVELEAKARWERWSIEGNYTYTEAEFKRQSNLVADLTAYPDHVFNLGLSFDETEPGWSFSLFNTFFVGAQSSALSGTTSYVNDEDLEPFWRTDLYGSYTFQRGGGNWQAYSAIRDLFDREDLTPSAVGVEDGIYGWGLSVVVGLRASF